jgi:hypothetical protein
MFLHTTLWKDPEMVDRLAIGYHEKEPRNHTDHFVDQAEGTPNY